MIDPASAIGQIDRRMFGSFIEHMGRAVYGGIFEPGHPAADADGWRRDVLDLVRELGVTVVRYPGGNFVSGYDWEDGIGPREDRPTRLDQAWRSIEPNLVGTDEFLAWARLAGVEPMLAVNLGTRGAEEAGRLVDYCNSTVRTSGGDRRAANGHEPPYGVRLWCLGNEMDGPWQIGHKTAIEYGRLAADAGRAMRLVDPTVELVVCGSSGSKMATFGTWEDTVLDLAWDVADHISLHSYYDPADFDGIDAYLACSRDLDRMIRTVAATADAVADRKGSARQIGLSVDEWNVWHMSEHRVREEAAGRPFRRAPAIAEDEQDLADALVVGCLLITLLRHAGRVRIACLAQLVNVIPPIRTLDGGPAWRQTTYFPFADVARFARGTVLRLEPDTPTHPVAGEGDVPGLEATAVHEASTGHVTIFAVNRLDRPLRFDATFVGLDVSNVEEHIVLAGPRLSASNTVERPDEVVPTRRPAAPVVGNRLAVELPARSWNVVRVAASS